jgi:diadenosine tetraphosphate (Ap4A) HIT family hydrolase
MNNTTACELCESEGGTTIFRSAKWRVARVDGADGQNYPGFCRVIWTDHVREMTDLDPADRQLFMRAVFCVEEALRGSLKPHKVNLASLGNLTPHLHWHVIPRYENDAAFPRPIWAPHPVSTREGAPLGTLGHRQGAESAETVDGSHWEAAVRRALETA